MTREQLAAIYLDWYNSLFTIKYFAEYYGFSEEEAKTLLNLARQCFEKPRPER